MIGSRGWGSVGSSAWLAESAAERCAVQEAVLRYYAESEVWCAREDSNLRPLPPQGSALSPELRAHAMVPKVRLELTRAKSPLRPERSASANSATSALSISGCVFTCGSDLLVGGTGLEPVTSRV